MLLYQVRIRQTSYAWIEVEAENEEAAMDAAQELATTDEDIVFEPYDLEAVDASE